MTIEELHEKQKETLCLLLKAMAHSDDREHNLNYSDLETIAMLEKRYWDLRAEEQRLKYGERAQCLNV